METRVSTKELIEKIEALPPPQRAEVEALVESLLRPDTRPRPATRDRQTLMTRIDERRARLLQEHGLFDTLPLIREFRETGGR